MGRPAKLIKVEDVVKGLGVEHIEIVDPNNIKETTEAYKRALKHKGPSVVVSKYPCILLEVAKKRRAGEKISVYAVDPEKCKQCKTCFGRFGCPAIYFGEDGIVHIDETLCNGCGNCVQVCPFNAIYEKGEKK
jgi:indolepyruvate ferredoxin oxidoreductase alpha subunit